MRWLNALELQLLAVAGGGAPPLFAARTLHVGSATVHAPPPVPRGPVNNSDVGARVAKYVPPIGASKTRVLLAS